MQFLLSSLLIITHCFFVIRIIAGEPIPMVPDYFVILESQDYISQDKSIIISSQDDFTPVESRLPVFEDAGNDSSGTDDFEVPSTRSG